MRGGACILYGANSFIITVASATEDCIDSQSQPRACNAVKYAMCCKSRTCQWFTGIDYKSKIAAGAFTFSRLFQLSYRHPLIWMTFIFQKYVWITSGKLPVADIYVILLLPEKFVGLYIYNWKQNCVMNTRALSKICTTNIYVRVMLLKSQSVSELSSIRHTLLEVQFESNKLFRQQ